MEKESRMPRPVARAQQQQQAPTWGEEETRELINIRVELEKELSPATRNRILWVVVSFRLKDLGFERSPDQCRCKWNNLLNSFKGKETIDIENGRKFPFFDELNRGVSEKTSNLQQVHVDSENPSASGKSKLKRTRADQSSCEISEGGEENNCESEDDGVSKGSSGRRKVMKAEYAKSLKGSSGTQTSRTDGDESHDLLKEFLHQQLTMEIKWREMMEKRANERLASDQEWRHTMVKLERERLLLEQAWREREEQKREREESRAERRDALLTNLLNSLLHEGQRK